MHHYDYESMTDHNDFGLKMVVAGHLSTAVIAPVSWSNVMSRSLSRDTPVLKRSYLEDRSLELNLISKANKRDSTAYY